MEGASSIHNEQRNRHKISTGEVDGKRPRGRWENNIKTDLKETMSGCGLN